MKKECCGAEPESREIDGRWYQVCGQCGLLYSLPNLKLTPEQVKAIRWPTGDEIFTLILHIADEHKDKDHAFHLEWTVKLAIRYALQDLMPDQREDTPERSEDEAKQ